MDICPPFYWYSGVSSPVIVPVALLRLPGVPPSRPAFFIPIAVGYNDCSSEQFNFDMNHADHLNLIRKGVPIQGGVWAEFGSGRGAFTLALAELIGMNGVIFSVDKDKWALEEQELAIQSRREGRAPKIHYLPVDYTTPLDLPPLDGLLMANSLHFQRDKKTILRAVQNYLSPGGCLILVEYNINRRNPWVPYPIPYSDWEVLAQDCGFINTRILRTRPSRSMREIYSAASDKPA